MEARLQRRVQRYGWDLAADVYEALWQAQLAPAQAALLDGAAAAPGESVAVEITAATSQTLAGEESLLARAGAGAA